ncbi:MAG: Uma2 family endonuclease [Isosphaeraceae bacterium]
MSTVSLEATTEPAGEPTAATTLEPEGHYEVVRGIVVEKPAMGVYETHIASVLMSMPADFLKTHRMGHLESEMLFSLDAAVDLKRRPDLAFVSYQRWSRDRAVPRTAAWDVVPDLAIEIMSPTKLASAVPAKVAEYFQHGVRCVWVVYPVEEQVYVYDSVTSVRILTRADRLAVPSILPQFELPLESLFETGSPAN